MNALFNSALRQSSALRSDLDKFADGVNTSAAAQGQISASLTSFTRTVDDYQKLAKQEPVALKQEKAFDRIKTFRAEAQDYRQRFDKLREELNQTQTIHERNELLSRRPHHSSTPENPYANSSNAAANSAFRPQTQGPAYPEADRQSHAFREQSFANYANTQVDEFIDRGRAVLENLGDQRETLKRTQRRLYGVANTLGISGDTIRMVERRARQDKWIFWAGVMIFFVFCYFVLRFFK